VAAVLPWLGSKVAQRTVRESGDAAAAAAALACLPRCRRPRLLSSPAKHLAAARPDAAWQWQETALRPAGLPEESWAFAS